MIKTFVAAALVSAAFVIPAQADDMMKTKCDDATMKTVTDAMSKVADAKMADGVKTASDEMKMAMDAMKANKTDECTKHVGMAMDQMMMKHNQASELPSRAALMADLFVW